MNVGSATTALVDQVGLALVPAALGAAIALASGASLAAEQPNVDADGTIHVPAFDLPESSLLDQETRAALERARVAEGTLEAAFDFKTCPAIESADPGAMAEVRKCQAEALYETAFYKRLRKRYPVAVAPQQMGGVYTEVFTPEDGVAPGNTDRVLINVHGGGWRGGARTVSHLESIPIAALGRIKVVSIDYRLAPEHAFPAATEDVAAVYRVLLETYRPQNIGLYGCSAGGLLVAQSVAWFQKEPLPPPAAVGMFCGSANYWGGGDSGHIGAARRGSPRVAVHENPYFKHVDPNDPLVFPALSAEILKKFPPSLLISSMRDNALSNTVHTHSLLVKYGVEADLHVWEGLDHAFFFDPDLPQSREVHDVVVRFFDRHLGRPASAGVSIPDTPREEALRGEVDRFVRADAASPPAPCRVLFVGSSSIVKWQSLAQDMAPLPVINRGFGASHIEYVNRWFEQVVAPYKPRAIVFYAGENDLAADKSPERVIADFDEFMTKKTAALGATPVYFIALKPSKRRWAQFEQQSQVNDAIRERAKRRTDLHYVDVVTPMLENGKPKDLFVADQLHLSAQGYAVWTRSVRAQLMRNARVDERRCHP